MASHSFSAVFFSEVETPANKVVNEEENFHGVLIARINSPEATPDPFSSKPPRKLNRL